MVPIVYIVYTNCRVKWYVSFNYILPEVDVGESGYGVVNKDESS